MHVVNLQLDQRLRKCSNLLIECVECGIMYCNRGFSIFTTAKKLPSCIKKHRVFDSSQSMTIMHTRIIFIASLVAIYFSETSNNFTQ